ncbi:MAG TPA: TRZ/ATZ family hydrolase [Gammaproteobacteria bacterium]|nr:TRZ/ATZ family hydrolase [Gammaproteobacteria bacterium]
MQNIDTLIHARWIIPVEPENIVHENYSLAIHEGHILELLPTDQAKEKYLSRNVQNLTEHALIPGLINTHTHAAMSLFRGLSDDLPLMEWLNDHIWPAEGKWVNSEFVQDGTELAIAEMIRGGTTTFSDMYFFPDVAAHVADKSGIRAVVGMIIIDFPTVWASSAGEYISKGLEVNERYRHHPRITTAFAPHAPYTVSDEPLQQINTLAEQLDIPVHIHLHETDDEIKQSLENHKERPLQRLTRLGLLSPRLIAVHMTHLNDDEISQVAQAGAHVVHCPESNLKLASGFCPVHKIMSTGGNVALGTDGAASNNDLDMFGEMRTAALLAKAVANDASALPAERALKMATLNGAKALGIDNKTGSLKAGKAADITAVHLGSLENQPIYHPVSQIVYTSGRHNVTDVWVAGQHLLKSGMLTTLDEDKIKQKTLRWQECIAED